MMTKEDAKPVEGARKWAFKDALVAIPLVSSALALTWEFGYFLRIRGGAFNLFSIAEHISFALQALPFAVLISANIALWMAPGNKIGQSTKPRASLRKRTTTFLLYVVGFSVLLFCAITFVHVLYMFMFVFAAIAFVGTAIILLGPNPPEREPNIIVGVFALFVLTVALGYDIANKEIVSTRPLTTIKTNEGELHVRMLKSGERGILYFDPVPRTFGLVPWASVKAVDWK